MYFSHIMFSGTHICVSPRTHMQKSIYIILWQYTFLKRFNAQNLSYSMIYRTISSLVCVYRSLFNFTIFPMILFHFFSQISYILVFHVCPYIWLFRYTCLYLKIQSLIFYEYFCDLHKWYLLKFYFDFLLLSFNFMLEFYAVYVCWNTDIHCMTTFYFPTLLALLLPSSPCNYKHNVLFPREPLRRIPRDFQVALQKTMRA